jgi:hypothetical protein
MKLSRIDTGGMPKWGNGSRQQKVMWLDLFSIYLAAIEILEATNQRWVIQCHTADGRLRQPTRPCKGPAKGVFRNYAFPQRRDPTLSKFLWIPGIQEVTEAVFRGFGL